jgi:hypothetical protein
MLVPALNKLQYPQIVILASYVATLPLRPVEHVLEQIVPETVFRALVRLQAIVPVLERPMKVLLHLTVLRAQDFLVAFPHLIQTVTVSLTLLIRMLPVALPPLHPAPVWVTTPVETMKVPASFHAAVSAITLIRNKMKHKCVPCVI